MYIVGALIGVAAMATLLVLDARYGWAFETMQLFMAYFAVTWAAASIVAVAARSMDVWVALTAVVTFGALPVLLMCLFAGWLLQRFTPHLFSTMTAGYPCRD